VSERNYEDFQCPTCGSSLKHDTPAGSMICPTCGYVENACQENTDNVMFDFAGTENNPSFQDWGVPVQTVICSGCGGKAVVTAPEGSLNCTFCGSQQITALDEAPGIHPDSIIPFKLDRDKAQASISDWINKRYLAPFSFKSEYLPGQFAGIYIPYWSFDAQINAAYTGQAANNYTDMEIDTVTSDDRTDTKKRKVKKLRWRFVAGTIEKKFKNVMFSDTVQLDAKTLENLEPFKLNELVKYSPKHLAGYAAGHCKSGLAQIWKRAQSYMGGLVREEARSTVKRGSDVVGAVNTCATFSEIAFKKLLLPVWITSYKYKNKIYHIYINGQTGMMVGESPKSVLKIGIIALTVAAVVGALILFL